MRTLIPKRYRRWIPVLALVLVAFGVNLDRFGIDLDRLANGDAPAAGLSSPRWSSTEPNINLRHVFEGEINRGGEPVGFHSRPGGEDPPHARLLRVRDRPNRFGVYTGQVEIDDGDRRPSKFSSFFPDTLSRDDVVAAILNAYDESPNPRAQPWSGPSGLGFSIQGYTSSRGGINTAFPVFTATP